MHVTHGVKDVYTLCGFLRLPPQMTKSNIVSHTHKQLIQAQTVYFHFIFILFDQNKKKTLVKYELSSNNMTHSSLSHSY